MFGKNFVFIRKLISERQNNFSFGLHPAGFSVFNPTNGQGWKFRFPGKLCLAHEKPLSDFPYGIAAQFILPISQNLINPYL